MLVILLCFVDGYKPSEKCRNGRCGFARRRQKLLKQDLGPLEGWDRTTSEKKSADNDKARCVMPMQTSQDHDAVWWMSDLKYENTFPFISPTNTRLNCYIHRSFVCM